MYSDEHKIFLKKIRRNKFLIKIARFSILVTFILIWELLAQYRLIDTFIFSSPKAVVITFFNLIKYNNLFHHVMVTIYETFISFSIGTFLGYLTASILWWNENLYKIFDPYLTVLNSLPKVALGPIIIIWAGAGMRSIILMALFISVIITIINIYQGFMEVDKIKYKLLYSMKASKFQIYSKLMIPGSIPAFISTLKVNISLTLIGVIMGEFLVSKEGIGYLIMYGSQVFNLNLVITGIIILGIVASLMYYLVCYIEKKLVNHD